MVKSPDVSSTVEVVRLSREMGYTHKDFFKFFEPLAKQWLCNISTLGVDVTYDGGRVLIRLGSEGQRKIASIVLPKTQVIFEFHNLNHEQQERFMYRFDLAFRRGGG